MREITVKEIVGLNPCSQYTEEYVGKLFNGQETVSIQYILDSPIPKLDKIWIIDKTGLITEDQHSKIHASIMALVPADSSYAEKFSTARIWEYAPICIYLRDLNNQTTDQVVKIIDDKIISEIMEISHDNS
jgi:hypothetical protein